MLTSWPAVLLEDIFIAYIVHLQSFCVLIYSEARTVYLVLISNIKVKILPYDPLCCVHYYMQKHGKHSVCGFRISLSYTKHVNIMYMGISVCENQITLPIEIKTWKYICIYKYNKNLQMYANLYLFVFVPSNAASPTAALQ